MPGSADLLASFLPGPLRLRLATRPEVPEGLLAEETDLVAMQMDVSGFSGLTERLAADPTIGTEEIVAELNRYFHGLIGTVDRHGGLMVGFGGDSLVAVWMTGASPAEAALAAGDCALDALDTISRLGGGSQRGLDFRIGIGAGRAVMLDLGGFRGRRQFLVAGPAVAAMGSAVVDVAPGEVAVSGEVARLLGQSRFVPTASGMFRLLAVERPPLEFAAMPPARLDGDVSPAIEAYLPAGIVEFLGEDEAVWHSEYLTTTSLFLNMRGLDLTDARDRNALQLVVRTAQETFDNFEGTLTGILADDKALTLLGVFGLPPLVHEEDALRAVAAGQALDRALLDIRLDHGIGITTGRAFTGLYGTDVFRARAVVGPSVNLAARLMQAAGNEVLCDRATRRATRGRVHFAPLAPIRLKGHEELVEAYRPIWTVQPGVTATDLGPLVGRDDERSVIQRRLGAAARGEPTVLVLEGEAGIGKTRLVVEAMDTGRLFGFTVLTGGGHPVETAPYSAWRTLCGEALGFDTIVDPTERIRVLRQRFEAIPDGADLAPLLGVVLGIDVPGTPVTAALTPEGRRMRTATAVVELLRSLTGTPLLIVIEDCHWLDAASWDLLNQVHQELAEAALVLTTRPFTGERPAVLEELVSASEGSLLRLERIPAEAARRLAGDRFGVAELPEDLAALIEAKAEGHPLFIEELVYSLRDQGYVEVVGGNVATAVPGERLANLDLPDTVHGVTSSRLSRLSAIEQTTIKVASVLGGGFDAHLLAAIHPLSLDERLIAEQLDDLARRDLIRPTETGFAFRHAVVQESAYEQLPLSMRRRLHEQVATRIEEAGSDATQYPLLAHHWEAAGHLESALDYLEGAGAAALEAGAFDDAASFLERGPGQSGPTRCARQRHFPLLAAPTSTNHWGKRWPDRAGSSRRSSEYQAALAKLGHGLSGGWFRATAGFIKDVFVQIDASARKTAQTGSPGRRHTTGSFHPLGSGPGPLLPGRCAPLAGDQPAFHQPGRTGGGPWGSRSRLCRSGKPGRIDPASPSRPSLLPVCQGRSDAAAVRGSTGTARRQDRARHHHPIPRGGRPLRGRPSARRKGRPQCRGDRPARQDGRCRRADRLGRLWGRARRSWVRSNHLWPARPGETGPERARRRWSQARPAATRDLGQDTAHTATGLRERHRRSGPLQRCSLIGGGEGRQHRPRASPHHPGPRSRSRRAPRRGSSGAGRSRRCVAAVPDLPPPHLLHRLVRILDGPGCRRGPRRPRRVEVVSFRSAPLLAAASLRPRPAPALQREICAAARTASPQPGATS